jgi:hypothetical protein
LAERWPTVRKDSPARVCIKNVLARGPTSGRFILDNMPVVTTLFAERFAVPTEDGPTRPEMPVYDERRHYNLAAGGRPFVELEVVGATVTMTRVSAEPDDADRAWEDVLASVDTITKAARDRDPWQQ